MFQFHFIQVPIYYSVLFNFSFRSSVPYSVYSLNVSIIHPVYSHTVSSLHSFCVIHSPILYPIHFINVTILYQILDSRMHSLFKFWTCASFCSVYQIHFCSNFIHKSDLNQICPPPSPLPPSSTFSFLFRNLFTFPRIDFLCAFLRSFASVLPSSSRKSYVCFSSFPSKPRR